MREERMKVTWNAVNGKKTAFVNKIIDDYILVELEDNKCLMLRQDAVRVIPL